MPASTTPAPSEKAFANAGTEGGTCGIDTRVCGIDTRVDAGPYPVTALARERDHGYAPARQTEPRAHAGALDFGFYRVHGGGLLQRVARRETIRRHQLHTRRHQREIAAQGDLYGHCLLPGVDQLDVDLLPIGGARGSSVQVARVAGDLQQVRREVIAIQLHRSEEQRLNSS